MAILTKAKTLTAVALAATAFTALPVAASASDYRCEQKNDEAQVIGGLLGAVVGGVVGSEVAGRGDRNEGAVIGALVGAAAGAGLGDESVKCRREQTNIRRTTTYSNTSNSYRPAIVTVGHRGYSSNQRHYNNRNYNYGYNDHYSRRLNRIDRRLSALRAERQDLKYRNQFDRRRWIDRRLNAINHEIRDLKHRRKSVKRVNYNKRDRGYKDYRRRH